MLIFDSKYGNKYLWSNLLTQQFVLNFFKPKWFFFVYLFWFSKLIKMIIK